MKQYIEMMTPLPPEYSAFEQLWARGEYFECHEELEIAWRREENPERKQFLQGLIHCAVALVHVQRKNEIGARAQWKKAQAKLQRFGPEYSGCHINAVLEFVEYKLNEKFNSRFGVGNIL